MSANLSESHVQKRAAVEAIISAWKNKDIDGVLAQLSENVEYHFLVGERPLIGKAWVRKFLEKFGGHISDENNWRLRQTAENGDALLVEGIDDYISTDGNRICYPYMGVFEFRDGLITGWRDYADGSLIAGQRAGNAVPDWLEALVA